MSSQNEISVIIAVESRKYQTLVSPFHLYKIYSTSAPDSPWPFPFRFGPNKNISLKFFPLNFNFGKNTRAVHFEMPSFLHPEEQKKEKKEDMFWGE